MKKWFIVSLLFVLTCSCGKSPQERIFELFHQGLDQMERYDFEAALATFEKVGEIEPSSPLGYYGSGLVQERQMRYYDALHVFMAITNAEPAFAPAYESLYRMLTRLKQWEDAAPVAAEYVRLLPEDPGARRLLAEALVNIDQPGRARRELIEALNLGADSTAIQAAVARTYALEHNPDSAAVAFDEAMHADEKSFEFYAAAAEYYQKVGLVDSAQEMGRTAWEAADYDFHLGLEHFYRSLDNRYFFDARQVIRGLKDKGATAQTIIGLDFFYNLAIDHLTKARHASDSFAVLYPNTVTSYAYDLAIWGREYGDLMTGSQDLNAIVHLMSVNNYDVEYQDYVRYLLAIDYARYFVDMSTLQVLEKVPNVYTNRKEIRLQTARMQMRTGATEDFKETMVLLSQYHGTQPDWLTGMGDVYRDIRDYDQADEHYRLALKNDPWYRPAFENLVNMYRQAKQSQKALGVFAAYPYFEQQYPQSALLKSVCLVENGLTEEGVKLFRDNYIQVKGDLTRFTEMSRLLERKGHYQERTQLFQMLPTVNATNADALTLSAENECNRHEYQTALTLAKKALSIEPDLISASVQQARALFATGQRTEALDMFEANTFKDRFDIDNNYYYSRILAEENIDPAKAQNLARRAVFDGLHGLKVWMNLCYVYYQTGRFDLSRGEALKAIRKFPDEPEPYFRAGIAMYREGKEDTRETLQKAIDLGLRGELLETARSTLEKL